MRGVALSAAPGIRMSFSLLCAPECKDMTDVHRLHVEVGRLRLCYGAGV